MIMDIGRALFCVCVLVFVSCVLLVQGRPSTQGGLSVQSNGCACDKQTEDCGCCAHIKFDVLHVKVDDDACVNITYLPQQYGLSLTFAWNGKIIFNETVSASNPPPFCFGVPHVKLLDICIRLYNISYDKEHFGGCIALEFEVLHIKKDISLGCVYRHQAETRPKKPTLSDILKWIIDMKVQAMHGFLSGLIQDVDDMLDGSQATKENRRDGEQSFHKPAI